VRSTLSCLTARGKRLRQAPPGPLNSIFQTSTRTNATERFWRRSRFAAASPRRMRKDPIDRGFGRVARRQIAADRLDIVSIGHHVHVRGGKRGRAPPIGMPRAGAHDPMLRRCEPAVDRKRFGPVICRYGLDRSARPFATRPYCSRRGPALLLADLAGFSGELA
jgi:hypothetical protein